MDIQFAKARRTLVAPAILLAALASGACTTTPHQVVIAAKEVKLSELVDSRVQFTGVVHGPGEFGDYITISGNRVYLDTMKVGDRNGQRATVSGRLRHFVPPTAAECAKGCKDANVPEHYWIEGGKITSAPAQ